jgi:hypothetical protein
MTDQWFHAVEQDLHAVDIEQQRQLMRARDRLWVQGPMASEAPEAVGQVLIRIMAGGQIILYPIVFDRAQTVNCHAALQDLVRQWVEQPERLAELCELDLQTAPAVPTAVIAS